MDTFDILLLGLALSADAFSVTISNTFAYSSAPRRRLLLMPLFFGLFQGFMPVVGYFLSGVASTFIERYAGVITLVILGLIGGNMVREGVGALLHPDEEPEVEARASGLTIGLLLFQAAATAIDAFAVGVSLRAEAVNIWWAGSVICMTTALCCVLALAIGRRLGPLLGDRAEVVGGCVLIGIGLKAFFS